VIAKTIAMLLALAFSLPAIAQEAPQSAQRNTLAERYPQLPITPEQVARPGGGGNIAGDVKLQLVKVADGLYDPVNVVSANDGSGRLFVVERSGRIVIVKDGKVLEEPFLDITDIVLQAMLEQGMYDIAFHPDFAEKAGLIKLFGISEEVFAKIHTEARPEIWAYGLRNPWKFHFDPKNGDMYIAEVGQNHWEEIDLAWGNDFGAVDVRQVKKITGGGGS
jgi:glucose/arabinose dehydrogenase